MTVEHLEVLVEEPSMEAALRLILPAMLPGVGIGIHAHQGKSDLMVKLPNKLAAYAAWIPATWRILVVVDRDDDECEQLKATLQQHAAAANLATRDATTGNAPYQVMNRIAVEELEAWYFGDWAAVRVAYPRVSATISSKAQYRIPDEIRGGTWEAFERVLQSAGYFSGGLRKIEAARAIAAHMVPARNTSPSFCALRDGLAHMIA